MKKFFTLFCLLISALATQAQVEPDSIIPQTALPLPDPDTTYWQHQFNFSANLNQATFSENWQGGGINSLSIGSLLLAKNVYTRGQWCFSNLTELQYGTVRNEGQNTRKATDRIFEDIALNYKFSPRWSLVANTNFITQFAPGRTYSDDDPQGENAPRISDFMNPAYLTNSVGFEYKLGKVFFARMGVGGLRTTFVLDTTLYRNSPKNYGVPIGDRSRTQAVFQLMLNYDQEIWKNIFLRARYLGTADYENLAGQGFVHRLDVVLTAKVNKYISTNFILNTIYDIDQADKIQYTQVLGLGVSVNIGGEIKR